MRFSKSALTALVLLALFEAACGQVTPTETVPSQLVNTEPAPTITPPVAAATLGANETPFANPAQTPATLPTAASAFCANGGAPNVGPNDPLAARVNGDPVPLALYQRQAAQAQAALVGQGLDPKSKNGQDTIKGLDEQVLGQLIDDVLVEQAARQQNVTVTNQDVDNRVQQMMDDVGGRSKFDDWLKTNQLQLADLCTQLRSSIFGEIMLDRVTANLPTKVEQIHAAQILLATKPDADKVLALVKQGKDFGELAKQYSKDESTRDNGGDLGWFPQGVKPPEFDAAAFKLQPGQVTDVVTTSFGFHIIKVLERDASRELSPEFLQFQKQQAFFAWLDNQRNQSKIEKLINP